MTNVVLTGCTRGLGLAIAQLLVQQGYTVIGIGRQPSDAYNDLTQASLLGKACFLKFDLENVLGIPSLFSAITRDHGRIYGLINNAAIGVDGVLATMHASDISRAMTVNLEAAITMTKYASRSMIPASEGRIINISSIIARTGFNGLSVYAATKAGLEGFTRSLARELGRARITVNCVAPGYMETDMTSALQGDKLASIRRRAPLGLPRVDDVASAVSFLLSREAERISGTVLTVDGGSSA